MNNKKQDTEKNIEEVVKSESIHTEPDEKEKDFELILNDYAPAINISDYPSDDSTLKEDIRNEIYKKVIADDYVIGENEQFLENAIRKNKDSLGAKLGSVSENDIKDDYKETLIKENIESQKKSLDPWIDYLLEEDNMPKWAKLLLFKKVTESREDITSNFTEFNPEAVAETINEVIDTQNNKTPEEMDSTDLIDMYNKNIKLVNSPEYKEKILQETHGSWIEYKQDTDKLIEDLKDKDTEWSIEGDSIDDNEENNNFLVYYSNDHYNKPKRPRILIKYDENGTIDIKGIRENGNIDKYILPRLIKKIEETPELKNDNVEKAIQDSKKIEELNNKSLSNEDLNIDDLVFLYELNDNIETFTSSKDPRIIDIISNRNLEEDLRIIDSSDIENINQDNYKKIVDSISLSKISDKYNNEQDLNEEDLIFLYELKDNISTLRTDETKIKTEIKNSRDERKDLNTVSEYIDQKNKERITQISEKIRKNEEITTEEIVFLYGLEDKLDKIKYIYDDRIPEIIKSRDLIKDIETIFDNKELISKNSDNEIQDLMDITKLIMSKNNSKVVLTNIKEFNVEQQKIIISSLETYHALDLLEYIVDFDTQLQEDLTYIAIRFNQQKYLAEIIDDLDTNAQKNIVSELIKTGHTETLISKLNRFDPDVQTVIGAEIINNGRGKLWEVAIENLSSFNPIAQARIAETLMSKEGGFGTGLVLEELDKFDSKAQEKIASKLISNDNIKDLIMFFDKFDSNSHAEIANTLIEKNKVKDLFDNFSRFDSSSHEYIAQSLINYDHGTDLIEKIENFDIEDTTTLVKMLIKQGRGGEVSKKLDKFNGVGWFKFQRMRLGNLLNI